MTDPYPSYNINGVQVTIAEDAKILLRGRTYDHREKIKSLGGTWDPATKTWALPPMTDVEWLKPPPPAERPVAPKPRLREQWTHEEYQNWLCRSMKKFHGPCCSHAMAYESRPYGPICYRCDLHGQTINDYTGD
jgi:hypothetical protein